MAKVGGLSGWNIEVTGLKQVLNALEVIDKSAAKEVTKTITDVAKRVKVDSTYLTPFSQPLSGWGQWTFSRDGRDLGFEPGAVASGFAVQRNNFRRKGTSAGIGFDVVQKNAGGAIFEVMGDGSRITTKSGKHMVSVVNKRFPRKKPRTLVQAYYQNMSQELRDSIRDHIINAAREAGLS